MDVDVNVDLAPPPKKKKEVVVEGMNEEDLKKYMFPNCPVEPSYEERILCNQLDAPRTLDDPLPSVDAPSDPKHDYYFKVSSKLTESFMKEFQRPKYHRLKANKFKPGEPVDFESLLFPCPGDYLIRRKGRSKIKATNLRGKYILVCCCYAPMVWPSPIWEAVYACSEMYSKLKGNFEMVVVTKMRRGWTHPRAKEKDAFRQFFSAFPPSCLAVPCHARSRRRHIFSTLGVAEFPNILLLGPGGHALLHRELMSYEIDLVPINVIGSDPTPFPFISTDYSPLSSPSLPECSWIVNNPSSLKRLLSPSSDFLFRKEGGCSKQEPLVNKEVSLSDLNSKPVALYLFSTGEKLPLLRHIVEGCGQANKDLEVVVVYLPVTRRSSSFPERFSQVLAARHLSWWVAPYNFSASIVLENMFEFQGDRVIIMGPNEQYVDVRGLQLMEIYGLYAYPFSFSAVVSKTVEELSQVTIDSFKKLLQIPEYPSTSTATAKKVLFYFDFPYEVSPIVYRRFRCSRLYQGVEIRPISFHNDGSLGIHAKNLCVCNSKHTDLTLPWYTEGADKAREFFFRFFNHVFPTIVAFGEDGRICSLLAHNHVRPSARRPKFKGNRRRPKPEFKGNCRRPEPEFKGSLYEEVSSILEKYIKDYDAKEYEYEGCYNHGLEYMQELRQSEFW